MKLIFGYNSAWNLKGKKTSSRRTLTKRKIAQILTLSMSQVVTIAVATHETVFLTESALLVRRFLAPLLVHPLVF
jgi:hypothetical protein